MHSGYFDSTSSETRNLGISSYRQLGISEYRQLAFSEYRNIGSKQELASSEQRTTSDERRVEEVGGSGGSP